jgi:HEAT repeat protein
MIWKFLTGTDQPTRSQIDRQIKKLVHPHGESANRMAAVDQLLEWNTPESIAAILKRFTIVASPATLDLEEKQHVCNLLIGVGRDIVDPLKTFLLREVQVYWPATALQGVLGEEEFKETMAEILLHLQNSYVRVSDQKRDLIRQVHGLDHPRLFEIAENFLTDASDDVRIAAAEYLFSVPNDQRRSAILEAIFAEEQSARFWLRFAELAAQKNWKVPSNHREQMQKQLPPDFYMTSHGELKQRPKK